MNELKRLRALAWSLPAPYAAGVRRDGETWLVRGMYAGRPFRIHCSGVSYMLTYGEEEQPLSDEPARELAYALHALWACLDRHQRLHAASGADHEGLGDLAPQGLVVAGGAVEEVPVGEGEEERVEDDAR